MQHTSGELVGIGVLGFLVGALSIGIVIAWIFREEE